MRHGARDATRCAGCDTVRGMRHVVVGQGVQRADRTVSRSVLEELRGIGGWDKA